MTLQASSFILSLLVLSLYLENFANPKPVLHKHKSFEFINSLKGSKKGDKLDGIQKLKQYLNHFGYLDSKHLINTNNDNNIGDYFDENLESAIKTYQLNFNLMPTGFLDEKTVSTMAMPRCGCPDIIDGKTRMKAARYDPNYAFFDGQPKWPPSTFQIYYAFVPGTRDDFLEPFQQAFLIWSGVTPFSYGYNGNYTNAIIKIGLQRVDGAEGVLAFAYAPTNGTVIFDAAENWVVGEVPGGFDIETVALHELGHALGLAHSSDENAIMYPSVSPGKVKSVNDDDLQGMRVLYPS